MAPSKQILASTSSGSGSFNPALKSSSNCVSESEPSALGPIFLDIGSAPERLLTATKLSPCSLRKKEIVITCGKTKKRPSAMSTASGKGVENHTNHLCMALETLVHAHGCSRNLIFWIVDDHDLGRIHDFPFADECGTRNSIGDVVEHFRIARIPQHA